MSKLVNKIYDQLWADGLTIEDVDASVYEQSIKAAIANTVDYDQIIRIIKGNSEVIEAYADDGTLDSWEAVNTTILLKALEDLK